MIVVIIVVIVLIIIVVITTGLLRTHLLQVLLRGGLLLEVLEKK